MFNEVIIRDWVYALLEDRFWHQDLARIDHIQSNLMGWFPSLRLDVWRTYAIGQQSLALHQGPYDLEIEHEVDGSSTDLTF